MRTQSTHTPTPWSINPKALLVIESKLGMIASCGSTSTLRDQWEANTAFIVRAVNEYEKDKAEIAGLKEALEVERIRFNDCHEGLLEALKALRSRANETCGASDLMEQVDRAITKAEVK